jgi:formylglycine-generating enzyme required for sulfatase activity/tRNA A-37 threonylcarbamoyl transferase component Bud32
MEFSDEPTQINPATSQGSPFGGGRASLLPGEVIGQYKVIKLLGRGGMGEVHEVEHVELGKRYALKVISDEILDSAGALERFRREAQVMARVEHAHIVRVDDFGQTGGRYWLRMELAGGMAYEGEHWVSLAEALKSGVKLSESWVRTILAQILEGLDCAHGRGLIHRDIKPANILLSGGGAKIADFGLVKVAGEEWLRSQVEKSVARSMSMGAEATRLLEGSGTKGTSTKALLGTYAYMSPEQKRGDELDGRTDLYAVGLMAFQMLTGEETVGMELPSDINPELDPGWDDWVRRSIAVSADRRFGSAREMLTNLPSLIGEAVETPPPVEVERDLPRVVSPPMKKEVFQPVKDLQEGESFELELEGQNLGMIWIPPGKFVMGSPEEIKEGGFMGIGAKVVQQAESGRWVDEGPQTEVELTRGFWLGRTPVTVGQWKAVMGTDLRAQVVKALHDDTKYSEFLIFKDFNERQTIREFWGLECDSDPQSLLFEVDYELKMPYVSWEDLELPMPYVSWEDAMEFAQKLTERERLAGRLPVGYVYTLPSEAQWEYAARAGTTTRWSFGDDESRLGQYAWVDFGQTNQMPFPVGRKLANPHGLYDMHGNVREWTRSWYGTYPGGNVTDYEGPASGTDRVNRGGSGGSISEDARSAARESFAPGFRWTNLGFRLCLSAER